jgi:hypothetical protein
MPLLIGIGGLIALLLFIRWDRRRSPAPMSREQLSNGWTPSAVRFWHGFAAIALCELALALSHWVDAPSPPFSGRWGWFYSWSHNALGANGPAIATAAIAVALALLAVAAYRQEAQ